MITQASTSRIPEADIREPQISPTTELLRRCTDGR
jgi:hypothetical protein